MAALTQSPSGFSYAQAAKGRALTPSSKVISDSVTTTTTPALTEPASTSNWADDVEAAVGQGVSQSVKDSAEVVKTAPTKDTPVERTKQESTPQNGSSGLSSPDLGASSNATTNADDSSSAANGTSTSDTTWETKSQTSDPAWIVERKERQSAARNNESPSKSGKKPSKEPKEPAVPQPPQKPITYQEAPPPVVNFWAKRMEDAKTKTPVVPVTQKPAPATIPTPAVKPENQRPRANSSRKKASSVGGSSRVPEPQSKGTDVKKPDGPQGPLRSDAAATGPRKPAAREQQSLPDLTNAPPPVKDVVSWPTPDYAQGVERKESPVEKDPKDALDSDLTSDGKPRHKTSWKPMPVTPNIVWETEEMNRPRGHAGERGGRGGAGARGRGGLRGGANGAKGGDRTAGRSSSVQGEAESGPSAGQRSRSHTSDREAMPPPPKPNHASSNGGLSEGSNGRGHTASNGLTNVKPTAHASLPTVSGTSPAVPRRSSASLRTGFPQKIGSTNRNGFEDAKGPGSNSRANTAVAQFDDGRDAFDNNARDMSSRGAPADGRKDSRSFEAYGKDWNTTPRGGGKRGGRGRGGPRDFSNGHVNNPSFANGHAEFGANSPYGVPPSPSAFAGRNGQFGFPAPGRTNWPRSNPRSQSIPVDNAYNPRFASFGGPGQLAPVPTYQQGMYDYNGAPMSAVSYNPMMDHAYLSQMVSTQLEYYFSYENLIKDVFLRKHMDSQGFVFLDVVAQFNRLKQLTQDRELILAVCLRSDSIEIRVGDDGKERLRPRELRDKFVLPIDQRELSAQTEGPKELLRPDVPQMHLYNPNPMMYHRTMPEHPLSSRRSYDSGYVSATGTAPPFAPFAVPGDPAYAEAPTGEEPRGRAAKSPMRGHGFTPEAPSFVRAASNKENDPDDFPDDKANELTVVVKSLSRVRHHHQASRTFSNGSIDSRSIFEEMEKPVEEHAPTATNGEPVVDGDSVDAGESQDSSPKAANMPEKTIADPGISLLWVKDTELPRERLPQGSTLEPFHQLRQKALEQREHAATGACPYDLNVLYQFWSHFLIRNFNKSMYTDFQYYAHDDGRVRHSDVGLQNLVQFYNKALLSSSTIRDAAVRDYIELVKNEPAILRGLAFKELRSAWRNGALNLKNRKKLTEFLDEPLKAQLEA